VPEDEEDDGAGATEDASPEDGWEPESLEEDDDGSVTSAV